MAKPIQMPFGLWARIGRKNHMLDVAWWSRDAEGCCHANQFCHAIYHNWLSMGYNFGSMIASNTLFESTG